MFYQCEIGPIPQDKESLLTELLFAADALSVTYASSTLTALFKTKKDLPLSETYTWTEISETSWIQTENVSLNENKIECDTNVFGNGDHPTTQFCLGYLKEVCDNFEKPANRYSLVDCGTGSGILSLYAWQRGIRDIMAFDYDETAVKNAKRNAQHQDIPSEIFSQLDIEKWVPREKVDICAANVLTTLIIKQLSKLSSTLKPKGFLIISGIGLQWKEEFETELQHNNLSIIKSCDDEKWCGYLLQKSPVTA